MIKINKYIHQDDPTDFDEGQIKRINKYRDYFASLKYDIESHDINFNIQKLQESRLIKESDIEKLQTEGLIKTHKEEWLVRVHKICISFEDLVQKYWPKLEGNIGKGPLPPKFSWTREFNRVKLLLAMIGVSNFEPIFTHWNPQIIPNNSGYKVYRGCQPYEELHLSDLRQLDIKHIINLRRESTDDEYFEGRAKEYGITTYWIPMFDQSYQRKNSVTFSYLS